MSSHVNIMVLGVLIAVSVVAAGVAIYKFESSKTDDKKDNPPKAYSRSTAGRTTFPSNPANGILWDDEERSYGIYADR